MVKRPKAVAFDVDPDSLVSLRHAFPEWDIETADGATTGSLSRDWAPVEADLLVVGARARAAETLGLCRALRSQPGRAQTPLLVLVPPQQESLVRAAIKAGAHGCLVLPIHPKEVASALAQARAGNRPGRHTLNLARAQSDDLWRDAGGES